MAQEDEKGALSYARGKREDFFLGRRNMSFGVSYRRRELSRGSSKTSQETRKTHATDRRCCEENYHDMMVSVGGGPVQLRKERTYGKGEGSWWPH